MKNIKLLLLLLILSLSLTAFSQESFDSKYIEVTGSAEMLIQPDEFIFIIGIEEFWKEEFEEDTEFEDYKEKVAIKDIEADLMKNLSELGIKNDQIKSTEVGNYRRYRGKEFLVGKRIEITLNDFSILNKIVSKVDRKGIDFMRIGELKHKKLQQFRKDVKKRALLAAKEKAEYLLESIDKELGDIISISEINSADFWRPSSSTSNVIMNSSSDSEAENDKKIKLRYEIRAKFQIK